MLDLFIASNDILAQIIHFDEDVSHSHQAAGLEKTYPIVKTIVCYTGGKDPLILAILEATQKVDFQKIKALLGVSEVRLATPEEVLNATGYEVGGVPPISIYGSPTLIDPGVLTHPWVACGGGDTHSLLKIQSADILKWAFEPRVEPIAK
ncbi:MAG: YbaK/EbsC family protein [Candidatus Diapherotrites archaeon]|nr:YbaK/EbsC family protein [Candidatus Diapherotrites archaeon]MDZ4256270.1 YbaK/EbsC family protein [archaeon]